MQQLDRFMDADFSRATARSLFSDVPKSVRLRPLNFELLDGPTLFEQVNQIR